VSVHENPERKFRRQQVMAADRLLPGDMFQLYRREWEITNVIVRDDSVVVQAQSTRERSGRAPLESEIELNLKQWFEIDRREV
jgi:hypothetical protein